MKNAMFLIMAAGAPGNRRCAGKCPQHSRERAYEEIGPLSLRWSEHRRNGAAGDNNAPIILRHSRESGNPERPPERLICLFLAETLRWIPVFAGMTKSRSVSRLLHTLFRGNGEEQQAGLTYSRARPRGAPPSGLPSPYPTPSARASLSSFRRRFRCRRMSPATSSTSRATRGFSPSSHSSAVVSGNRRSAAGDA